FHNSQAAQQAEEEVNRIFVSKGLPDDMPEVSLDSNEAVWVCRLLQQASLAPSTSEARRLIQGGGVEINGEKVKDVQLKLNLKSGDKYTLKAGKIKFAKILVK